MQEKVGKLDPLTTVMFMAPIVYVPVAASGCAWLWRLHLEELKFFGIAFFTVAWFVNGFANGNNYGPRAINFTIMASVVVLSAIAIGPFVCGCLALAVEPQARDLSLIILGIVLAAYASYWLHGKTKIIVSGV